MSKTQQHARQDHDLISFICRACMSDQQSVPLLRSSHQVISNRSNSSEEVVSIAPPAQAKAFARSSLRVTFREDVTATTPVFPTFSPPTAAAAGAFDLPRNPPSPPGICRWQCSHSVGPDPSPLTLGAPHPSHAPCSPGQGAWTRRPGTSTVSSSGFRSMSCCAGAAARSCVVLPPPRARGRPASRAVPFSMASSCCCCCLPLSLSARSSCVVTCSE